MRSRWLAAALACLLPAALCPAGRWLSAGIDPRRMPFDPVPLFWFRVVRCPVVYRTVVDVPPGTDAATALLKSAGYVYVWLDGREVYAWGAPKDTPERGRTPGEPDRIHELDLTGRLGPGRHVLAVSAPPGAADAGGFVLDGAFYGGGRRLGRLASDGTWTVTVFRPTEVLDDHPVLTAAYDGSGREGICTAARAVRVVGPAWEAPPAALADARRRAAAARRSRRLAEATWRLELLARKGIYIADDAPAGWSGPHRPPIAPFAARASAALAGGNEAEILRAAADLPRRAHQADEALRLALARRHVRAATGLAGPAPSDRADIERALGHPLGRLNESRFDRLGWLPLPALADSDISRWGVRIAAGPGPSRPRPVEGVDVLAGPLSPCAVLSLRGRVLRLEHPGRAELLLPPGRWCGGLDAARDGPLRANWALLWLTAPHGAGPQRPVLLVFREPPARIACAPGQTTVTFPTPGARVVAVRPWARAVPKKADPAVTEKVAFWSRAALAVPVNYLTFTRVLRKCGPWRDADVRHIPAAPILGQTVVYDYLETADAWGTKPRRLAPLPALCGLAMDHGFRGLKVSDAARLRAVQDGGPAGPYRVLPDAERVAYRYEIEPFPRLVGFTSWMFAGSDTGVAGNAREVELIAATGANSYRPQNNFCLERSPHFRDDPRTRVQILADFCRDANLTFINNIDETLGATREQVRADYAAWVRRRLLPHYDRLVPQLADRPFRQVAWDLVNEPVDHKAAAYNRTMKALTARIRRIDPRHLLYIEPPEGWAAVGRMNRIEPTGDPLTVYSFHDYTFRMKTPSDRWPTRERDITDICRTWWPAIEFALTRGVPLHCGEYGGFHAPTDGLLCQKTLLNDFLRLFDQFGMHHHYYSGREVYRRRLDGSLRPSNVVRAFRRYARRDDLNLPYRP